MTEVSIEAINKLILGTNKWGFVKTPYGKMYLGGNDDGIVVRYLHGIDYESESLTAWHSACAGAEVVVDVGAHTGIYSLAAFHAKAKHVVSVEPLWVNAARLVLNLRANGHSASGVTMAAAYSHSGLGSLAVSDYSKSTGYCSAGGRVLVNGGTGALVRLYKLDSLVNSDLHSKIKAVKIDVEGDTLKVLHGMPSILQHRPALMVELTEEPVRPFLDELGYSVQEMDGRNLFARSKP